MGPGGCWHLRRRVGPLLGTGAPSSKRTGWRGGATGQPGPVPWLREITRHVHLWGVSSMSIPQPPTPGYHLRHGLLAQFLLGVDKPTSRARGTSEDRARPGLISPHPGA